MAFKKGDPNINRSGRPKTSAINELRTALAAEGKSKGKDFWEEVAKKAFTHDKIMLAVMKKLVPDLNFSHIEGEVKYVSMEIIKIEQKPLNLVVGELPDSVKQRIAK